MREESEGERGKIGREVKRWGEREREERKWRGENDRVGKGRSNNWGEV